jgi:hypothetical protein
MALYIFIPPLPHTSLWRSALLFKNLDNFTFALYLHFQKYMHLLTENDLPYTKSEVAFAASKLQTGVESIRPF